MKPQPVPTAKNHQQPTRVTNTIWLFCGVVVLAFFSGVVGELVARTYISDVTIPDVIFTRSRGAMDSTATASTAIWAEALLQQQRDTIVTFFSATETDFRDIKQLGKGVVVSADGWLVTPTNVLGAATTVTVVFPNGTTLISNTIIRDNYSHVAYVKVTAQQLPVVTFMTTPAVLGQSIVSFTYAPLTGERLTFGQIENIAFNDSMTWSTAEQNLVYLFDQSSRPEYRGAPIFNSSGELVGLDALDHRVIPVRAISRSLYSVFDQQAVTTPHWQFEYNPTNFQITRLITPNLPLNVGDIITAVNGQTVDRKHDISELLIDDEGSPVDCTVLRDGVEQVIILSS